MKRLIKNNYKIIIGILIGIIISITTVYAVDAYIESNKVTYTNHNKKNVEEAIDELYERSGIHNDKWVDPILNGADPVLKDPLIPVEITDDGDVYYANENSEWYNYSEKRWANAVILVDEPTKEYTVGAKIEEDDIESYFVWIPRYQYKVWNLGNYTSTNTMSNMLNSKEDNDTSFRSMYGQSRLIDIKFGDVNDIPKMTEPTTTDVYYTHPAFTLGDKDLNGIWVGKFETGYKGATSKETAQVNNEEPTSVIIKPDVYSWRGISIKNRFMVSYNYDRELDSHMLKNTEWGAAAYLSHSAYGIGNEIRINNASDCKTGYAAAANSRQSTRTGESALSNDGTKTQPWNTATGFLASTTGNITGVYDMNGGSWESVAAYKKGSLGDSGFNSDSDFDGVYKNYIDIYDINSSKYTYNKRILGDATGEMGPFYQFYDGDGANRNHNGWYADTSTFIYNDEPWFLRGGGYDDGASAGQFFFEFRSGGPREYDSFRIALAVN